MSLYQVKKKFDRYFEPPQDYLELWKLEVLPNYQGKGYGKALVIGPDDDDRRRSGE